MSKRILSDEEKALWKQVMGGVSKLPSDKIVKPVPKAVPKVRGGGIDPSWVFQNETKSGTHLTVSQLSLRDVKDISIEATLDLHGYTLERAEKALEKFVVLNQSQGRRWVLIVTGKGGQGILREFVPAWLSRNANWIVGYTEAAAKHGGGGALYVHLRNLRKG